MKILAMFRMYTDSNRYITDEVSYQRMTRNYRLFPYPLHYCDNNMDFVIYYSNTALIINDQSSLSDHIIYYIDDSLNPDQYLSIIKYFEEYNYDLPDKDKCAIISLLEKSINNESKERRYKLWRKNLKTTTFQK